MPTDAQVSAAPSAESGVRRIRTLNAVVRHRHPDLRLAGPAPRSAADDEARQRIAQADRQALADLNDWLAANHLRSAGWYLGDGSLVIEGGEIRGLEVVDNKTDPSAAFPVGNTTGAEERDGVTWREVETRPVAVPLLVFVLAQIEAIKTAFDAVGIRADEPA